MDVLAEHPQDPTGGGGGATVNGKLAGRLGELARSLQGEDDFEATLATMVGAALDLIPGASDASISVVEARRTIRSHAPSSDLPSTIDALQEKFGQGPCLDAVWEQRIVRVPDLRHEPRWPAFAVAAAEAGASSMLCFQLYVEGDNLGAMNVYGADTDVFDEESAEIGLLVAAHAAVAFADAKRISNLLEAVRTRDLIGQAKGILMERFKITDHQAFLMLATASSRANTKLRDVAQHLTDTGALPGPS